MKPRRIQTHSILAVVLGAGGAACTAHAPARDAGVVAIAPAAPSAASTAPTVTPPGPAGEPGLEVAGAASATDVAESPPRAKGAPSLLGLRDEMADKGRAEALRHPERYRPLCDADGYPLVGNLVRKDPDAYAPSQFCKDLRAK